MSNIVRTKFAGLLRGLLRRFDDKVDAPRSMRPMADIPRPASNHPEQNQFHAPVAPANPDEIQLLLQPILAALPMELRAKIIATNTAGMTISIPIEKALSQLATGSVKISFGELRQLASNVFAVSGGEHDTKMVALPLNQILAQINPTLLARRSTQKQVEVNGDISNPFDARGQGVKISTQPKAQPMKTPTVIPPLPRLAPWHGVARRAAVDHR